MGRTGCLLSLAAAGAALAVVFVLSIRASAYVDPFDGTIENFWFEASLVVLGTLVALAALAALWSGRGPGGGGD